MRSSARLRAIGPSDRRWHRRDAERSPFSFLSEKGPRLEETGLDHEPAGDVTPATAFGGSLPYTKIHTRFLASVILGLIWVCFSFWVAQPWFNDLVFYVVFFQMIVSPAALRGYLQEIFRLPRDW